MQQDVDTSAGAWLNASGWSSGVPTAAEDAYIYGNSGSPITVVSTKHETVDRIGASGGATLLVNALSRFTATDGTTLRNARVVTNATAARRLLPHP